MDETSVNRWRSNSNEMTMKSSLAANSVKPLMMNFTRPYSPPPCAVEYYYWFDSSLDEHDVKTCLILILDLDLIPPTYTHTCVTYLPCPFLIIFALDETSLCYVMLCSQLSKLFILTLILILILPFSVYSIWSLAFYFELGLNKIYVSRQWQLSPFSFGGGTGSCTPHHNNEITLEEERFDAVNNIQILNHIFRHFPSPPPPLSLSKPP